jgi:hypothetical protein
MFTREYILDGSWNPKKSETPTPQFSGWPHDLRPKASSSPGLGRIFFWKDVVFPHPKEQEGCSHSQPVLTRIINSIVIIAGRMVECVGI